MELFVKQVFNRQTEVESHKRNNRYFKMQIL